ncbi:MAG TPA: hypothetical protein VMT04_03815, partial [Terriglobales bacterium]|nr:hypothetical protein [Terriglobales bacterium]
GVSGDIKSFENIGQAQGPAPTNLFVICRPLSVIYFTFSIFLFQFSTFGGLLRRPNGLLAMTADGHFYLK